MWKKSLKGVGTPLQTPNLGKSKMAAILEENLENCHKTWNNSLRIVVLVAKYVFLVEDEPKDNKNLYFDDLHMKSKMAAISFTFLCFEI